MDTSEFLKMDIFFLVTTVVVALIGIVGCVVGYYLIRVMRDLSEIVKTAKQQVRGISGDIDAVRSDIREGVHEVRENVAEGIASAKAYTKAVTGAGIVRVASNLFQAFVDEKVTTRPRRKARKKTKGEE